LKVVVDAVLPTGNRNAISLAAAVGQRPWTAAAIVRVRQTGVYFSTICINFN
jgi:hypothetical protein